MTLPTKQTNSNNNGPSNPLKTLSTVNPWWIPIAWKIWILEWGYSDIFETASKRARLVVFR
jgi:hypothetical protein